MVRVSSGDRSVLSNAASIPPCSLLVHPPPPPPPIGLAAATERELSPILCRAPGPWSWGVALPLPFPRPPILPGGLWVQKEPKGFLLFPGDFPPSLPSFFFFRGL